MPERYSFRPAAALQDIMRAADQRNTELARQAQEKNLKRLSLHSSTAWVDEDYQAGTIPTHFYVASSSVEPGRPELVEHTINFPPQDVSQFKDAIKALHQLYLNTNRPMALLGHDPEGFVKFLDALTQNPNATT